MKWDKSYFDLARTDLVVVSVLGDLRGVVECFVEILGAPGRFFQPLSCGTKLSTKIER